MMVFKTLVSFSILTLKHLENKFSTNSLVSYKLVMNPLREKGANPTGVFLDLPRLGVSQFRYSIIHVKQ